MGLVSMRLWDDSAGRDDESKTYVSEIVSWNYFSFDSSDFCRLSGLRFGREIIGTDQGTTTGGNRRADLRGDYQDLEEAKRQPEQIDAIMRGAAKSPKMRHQSGISNIHADRRSSVRDSPYSGGIGIGAELTRPNVWAVVYRVNQTRNVNTTLSSAEAGVFVQAN